MLFEYDPTRSGDVPRRLLTGFTGALHTDGYSGYAPAVRDQGLVHLACWAHARRGFTDTLKSLGLNPNKLPPDPPPKSLPPRKRGAATASTPTPSRTPSDRSASDDATGCSPTPCPAPTPAHGSTRSLKPPKPVPAKAGANLLEPYAYLCHVFTELPKAQSLPEVEALLPTRLDPDTLTRYSPQGPIINPRQ